MKTSTEQLIGKRVKISCYTYKNGKTHYGIVKSIAKETPKYSTLNVLIDGNAKTIKFANVWLKLVSDSIL